MVDDVTAAAPEKTFALDEFELMDQLRALRAQIPDQPELNPIVSVAFSLSRQLESGQMSIDELKALSARLLDRACIQRSLRLKQRIGYSDERATHRVFEHFLRARLATNTDPDRAFLDFQERWRRARTGIVLTAHPTFALSQGLSQRMTELASGGDGERISTLGYAHRPDNDISLDYEHQRAHETIAQLRNAYVDLLGDFFTIAAEAFDDAAYRLRPQLTTLASWVGYDLDGRTDITWRHSLMLRLNEKQTALEDIRQRFLALKHDCGESAAIQRLTRQIIAKLDLAAAAVDEQSKTLEQSAQSTAALAHAANTITRPDSYNLRSVEPLLELFDQLIAEIEAPAVKTRIAALSGLLEVTGLGHAHIHIRINAVQLHNAFRAFVHEPWTRDLSERQALARIVAMIGEVQPQSVNFETLELENSTAIRQFALIAQIKKHIDEQTPIRFLIAECESPATILIAVYFARLFDISDLLDISPLFETPAGLERGARLLERLLDEAAYRDYVRQRGRLCIQTGFSDAGRFIGQIAATLAIEQLHHRLADLLKRPQLALDGVEVLIFSTHGESMGRGAHPGDLHQRLHYVLSDQARRRFAGNGLALKHETSFQGGDGFLWFADAALAKQALAGIIMDGEIEQEQHDPFYTDHNLLFDFLLRLRAYQEQLFAHPGYRALLGAFGPNLLFKTGSRALKRQSDTATVADRGDPARMRAIPNNAILQQFGYIANVVAGLDAASGSERERFIELAGRSSRLRSLIGMIAHGKQLSSLNAVAANALLFDAGFWTWRGTWGREPQLETACRTLAGHLLEDTRTEAINRLTHHLRLDAAELHSLLEEIGIGAGAENGHADSECNTQDDGRLQLDLLQALRLALLFRVFLLSAQLPRFATRNDISHDQIMRQALALEIPQVLAFIRKTFPRRTMPGDAARFDEPASYRPHGMDDYGRIETEILEPLEQAYDLIRELGTGIAHHFGAFG